MFQLVDKFIAETSYECNICNITWFMLYNLHIILW